MPSGTIETYVGGGNGDGADAYDAIISPRGMARTGNPSAPDIYIADSGHHRVRRVDGDTGLIDTVAGNGVGGYSGDGGFGQNASLFLPWDVAVDGSGNVYIADVLNNRIRKVAPDGRISTLAGNGQQGYTGEGVATQEALNQPYGVAVGPDGNVYIADSGNNRIRKVSPPGCSATNCQISTVVGTGTAGFSGDGGAPLSATLRGPADVAFDNSGAMYIVDKGSHRVRRVANNIITTVAGGGTSLGDGGPGDKAALSSPSQVDTDSNGNAYIADTGYRRIRMLQAGSFIISTVAGTGEAGSTGDGGSPTQAQLFSPYGVVATTPGNFWLAQSITAPTSQYNRVRKVTDGRVIQSVIGGGLGDGGAALDALVDPQGGEAVDAGGVLPDLYFADGGNNVVRYVEGDTATMHTLAGTGAAGYSGDGGQAVNATLNFPTDVARDPTSAAVYIADSLNNVIRKITNGTITTVAGDGGWGFDGEGLAAQVHLAAPTGIDVDRNGVLYIADTSNNRVRKVVGGQISTVAGNGNWSSTGDEGPATNASLRSPADIVVADNGNIYIAETQSHRIRRIDTNGIIHAVAGTGTSGFSGDNGLATAARLYAPSNLSLDQGGNLFIADSSNKRIRRVDAATQVINTVAGNGQSGSSGDGGPATSASFSDPSGVAVDPSGATLFVAANGDGCVRLVDFGAGAPQPTPTFTRTAIPPTNTPIPPTNTPIPPTNTFTAIPPTNPGTPTRTPTIAPTRTPTSAPVTLAVSGHVSYYANAQVSVPGVGIDLIGPQSLTVLTNSSGNYSAANMVSGSWSIEPGKIGGIGTAVSSLDAARVLQVIAGITSFTANQRLACDATGDGTISALDAVRILQLSAGVIDRLPVAMACGSDWLFYPTPDAAQNQSLVTPQLTSGSCRPGSIDLDPMLASTTHQDFDAILFGDCTGNWTPAIGGALRLQAQSAVTVHAGSPRRAPGGGFRVPIYVQALASFQALDIKLGYDRRHLTLRAVTPRGAAAGALVSVNDDDPDVISISLASAQPIDDNAGAVLFLEFTSTADSDTAAVWLSRASVDEQTARVVTHGTR